MTEDESRFDIRTSDDHTEIDIDVSIHEEYHLTIHFHEGYGETVVKAVKWFVNLFRATPPSEITLETPSSGDYEVEELPGIPVSGDEQVGEGKGTEIPIHHLESDESLLKRVIPKWFK